MENERPPRKKSLGERWPWPEKHGGRAKKTKGPGSRAPPAPGGPGAHEPAEPPPQNWIPDPGHMCGELTADEQEAAAKYALEDLFAGKAPVPSASEASPHAVFTIGPPGSGKSTVADALVRAMAVHPAESYVVLDYDALIKYHPRFRDTWRVPDIFGRPTGVGYALGWMRCIDDLDDLGQALRRKIFTERYNVIVQTHAHTGLVEAQLAGYFVTLLYVGVPLALAQDRARKRAVETGRFLAPTLEIQDKHIAQTWARYKLHAPWYGLWADNVFVARNDRDGAPPGTRDDFAFINPHEAWPGSLVKMMAAIAAAHDEGADRA